MGRRAQLPTLARLELSQTVYDEVERKLLEAGHEHRFWRGPGTAIDMTGIWVEPQVSKQETDGRYCFGCDRVVAQPCERVCCMEAANQKVQGAEV